MKKIIIILLILAAVAGLSWSAVTTTYSDAWYGTLKYPVYSASTTMTVNVPSNAGAAPSGKFRAQVYGTCPSSASLPSQCSDREVFVLQLASGATFSIISRSSPTHAMWPAKTNIHHDWTAEDANEVVDDLNTKASISYVDEKIEQAVIGQIDLSSYAKTTWAEEQLSTKSNTTHTHPYEAADPAIQTHLSDEANPHHVSPAQLNLGNVDNTSDVSKPISTATQSALNQKAVALGPDDHYVTAAEKTVLANTSGVNTGDHIPSWEEVTSKPSTLSGFGITDALNSSWTPTWGQVGSKPTTLTGFGITDALSSSWTPTWGQVGSKPTTLTGYGITDALNSSWTPTWGQVGSKPTTLSGFGITDALNSSWTPTWGQIGSRPTHTCPSGQAVTALDLTNSIFTCETISGAGTNNWNEIINTPSTLTGYGITDALGSSWTPTWGQVGSKPTTLSGFGITNALNSSWTPTWGQVGSKPTTLTGFGITDGLTTDPTTTSCTYGKNSAGVYGCYTAISQQLETKSSPSATCDAGVLYRVTSGASGQQVHLCESANTLVLQGGAGTGNVISSGNPSVGKLATFVTDSTHVGSSPTPTQCLSGYYPSGIDAYGGATGCAPDQTGSGTYADHVSEVTTGQTFSTSTFNGTYKYAFTTGSTNTLPIPAANKSTEFDLVTTSVVTFNLPGNYGVRVISGATISAFPTGKGVTLQLAANSDGTAKIRSHGTTTWNFFTMLAFAQGATYSAGTAGWSVSPSSTQSFGTVSTSATGTLAYVITNSGAVGLDVGTVSAGTGTPISIASNNCASQTLNPSSSCTVTLAFTPHVATSYTDTVTIVTTELGSQYLYASGTGTTIGGGVCSSCSSTQTIWNAGNTTTGSDLGEYDIAHCFTTSQQWCASGVAWEVFDSGSDIGNQMQLWTSSSSLPSALISGATCTTNLPDSITAGQETQCYFSAPVTISAGNYCIVALRYVGTSGTIGYRYISDAGQTNASRSTGAWAHDNFPGQGRLIGCAP